MTEKFTLEFIVAFQQIFWIQYNIGIDDSTLCTLLYSNVKIFSFVSMHCDSFGNFRLKCWVKFLWKSLRWAWSMHMQAMVDFKFGGCDSPYLYLQSFSHELKFGFDEPFYMFKWNSKKITQNGYVKRIDWQHISLK